MEIELTLVAITLGNENSHTVDSTLSDGGRLHLSRAIHEEDILGAKDPHGFADLYVSGEIARSFKIGHKFKLTSET